jgi:L-ascorbate metabolism protein UlaG (beta-lactamase superfamily)
MLKSTSCVLHLLSWLLATALRSAEGFSVQSTASPAQIIFSQHFPEEKVKLGHDKLLLTYLEINGFVLTTNGVTMLIDPVLEGPLDFGIPQIYSGKKKTLPPTNLVASLPPIDCILITQGLDDHAHVRTLTKLASDTRFDTVPIVAPPSAKGALEESGMLRLANVRFLRHGEQTTVTSSTGRDERSSSSTIMGAMDIRATTGALVGPPWQTRENGYVLRPSPSTTTGTCTPSIYIEPHVEFQEEELRREAPIDVVITPIVGQRLPILDLINGPEQAVKLVNLLRPKVIIPMMNSDVEVSGIAAALVSQNGEVSDFYRGVLNSNAAKAKILQLVPGKDEIIEV